MRLRTQIPFLLTSKPLNSFEFVFHGEPENENFSIGMENEEKPQKINLPCSNRISLTRSLSLPSRGLNFRVFFQLRPCLFKENISELGGDCDFHRALPQRHSSW